MDRKTKVGSGVRFETEVLDYLDRIAEHEERSRSQIINRIVKEHAKRNGSPIQPHNSPSLFSSKRK